MAKAIALIRWLFTPPSVAGPWGSILWWEKRRIPINVLIGVYGILCLFVFVAAICYSDVLQPGEDAIEPIALMFAPIAFNLCYTFGWLVEAPVRAFAPGTSPKLGPHLLLAGLAFSFCVISLPAVLWVGYLCLHMLGAV